MAPPIVKATIQSIIISFMSCLVALYIKPNDPPHYFSILTYSAFSTPLNFLWQTYLEKHFPGFTLLKVEVDDGGKGVEVEKKLVIQNTVIKVLLDQTVAAVPNVVGYIGITRLLRGVPVDLCWEAVKEVRSSDILDETY